MVVFDMDDQHELNNSTKEDGNESKLETDDMFVTIPESNNPAVESENNDNNGEYFAGPPFEDY